MSTILGAQPTFAEESSKSQDVDMIVVKGQATGGMDSLITSEDLDNIQATDLGDIFRKDASVSVGGSVGMGQKIYVRNIGEDMLNITIDGAEQAGAVFHHSGRIAIEPDLLKQVEVEAGAGSATAGPGALGGSIRFTTKDPSDLLKDGELVGALLKETNFRNSDGNKTSGTVFARTESNAVSALISIVNSDHENSIDADGDEILGTESKQELYYGKVVFNIPGNNRLSLSTESLKEKGDILYKPELAAGARNVPEPTIGTRDTTIVNYELSPENIDFIDFSVNAYHTKQMQEREYSSIAYDGAVETHGATIQNKSRIFNQQLIVGVNYRSDESTLDDVDFTPSEFEEKGEVYGVYVQDIIDVTDQLTLSAGLRFDDYHLEDVENQEFDEQGASSNVSANFEFIPGVSISAGYAEALRGPEVKDSFKISTATNDADLEAEKSKNYEVGFDFNGDGFNVAVGGYQSVIENPIGGSTPWSRISENLKDDIETRGYFVKMDGSWDRFYSSISYNSAKSELDGDPVTRYVYSSTAVSKGDTLVVDLSYEVSQNLVFGYSAELVKDISDFEIEVGGETLEVEKPGYGVHDIYASWMPAEDDRLVLTVTVKNLFDKKYLDHGSVENFEGNAGYGGIIGSEEAGRDVRVAVAIRI
ncbi:membrane receptor protein [Gammaproteobacteria bacterium 45_16_T64]|nr:membrane receptor protein [Gammaproteobacteria bacterium 45_16_T64]